MIFEALPILRHSRKINVTKMSSHDERNIHFYVKTILALLLHLVCSYFVTQEQKVLKSYFESWVIFQRSQFVVKNQA